MRDTPAMLRPKLMTGTDLDATVRACTHLLGCDERYGVIDPMVRKDLERLLDESAAEQTERRAIAASSTPLGPSRHD
jgi:hypothetical protein